MKCPNCQTELEKEVKKKTRCPHCRKYIYFRGGELLSEEDLVIHTWGERMILFPEYFNLVDEQREVLAKRFNQKPSSRDIIWGVFSRLTDIYFKKKDYENLSLIFLQRARFLDEEGKTKQADKLREISQKMLDKHFDLKIKEFK
jgi:Zn-finger nucleic acid-binding protein